MDGVDIGGFPGRSGGEPSYSLEFPLDLNNPLSLPRHTRPRVLSTAAFRCRSKPPQLPRPGSKEWPLNGCLYGEVKPFRQGFHPRDPKSSCWLGAEYLPRGFGRLHSVVTRASDFSSLFLQCGLEGSLSERMRRGLIWGGSPAGVGGEWVQERTAQREKGRRTP